MMTELHTIFETVYDNLQTYLDQNSIYHPTITQKMVENYPLVICTEGESTNEYSTLSYQSKIYYYDMMKIQVLAKSQIVNETTIESEIISKEIADHIVCFFENNYHITIKRIPNVVSSDETTSEQIIFIRCKVDNRYPGKLILLPIEEENKTS